MTVVVPTYRERANITPRLANIAACEYPGGRLEVMVVDSASGNGTAEAAGAFAADNPGLRVRVLREAERGGKAAAINAALAHCATELVVITDAPTCFAADALRVIVRSSGDSGRRHRPQGYFEVTGNEGMVQREEASFWRMRNLLRTLEAGVDSTPFLSGELCCFRRRLVERLDVDSLADDMNIAMQVRRAGYRVVVNNRARFSEPRSNRAAELVETKTRRAAGGVQELLRARDMVGNRRYGWFGMADPAVGGDVLPAAACAGGGDRRRWDAEVVRGTWTAATEDGGRVGRRGCDVGARKRAEDRAAGCYVGVQRVAPGAGVVADLVPADGCALDPGAFHSRVRADEAEAVEGVLRG